MTPHFLASENTSFFASHIFRFPRFFVQVCKKNLLPTKLLSFVNIIFASGILFMLNINNTTKQNTSSWKELSNKSSTTSCLFPFLPLLSRLLLGVERPVCAESKQQHATSVIMHPRMQAIWGDMWQFSFTNMVNIYSNDYFQFCQRHSLNEQNWRLLHLMSLPAAFKSLIQTNDTLIWLFSF